MMSDLAHAPAKAEAGEGVEQRVMQYRKDSSDEDGFWRTCSGCYECEDGYPNGPYPHSTAFGCTLGGGCSDCGGIGATWDTTDYDQMARDMLADEESLAEQDLEALEEARQQVINTPETADFVAGVPLEAAHQRERWGSDHDAGKTPFDWFWLIGYLAQKAADAAVRGDVEKAKHHAISTAAALANWHCALSGGEARMRPGVSAEIQAAAEGRGKLSVALGAGLP